MKDHYKNLSVHGLLPLIAEERGLRFAFPGNDHPLTCVGSPASLPDAEMDIFVFRNPDECRIWASAVATVSSEAIEVVLPASKKPQFALLIRWDRSRREGETLEAVIGLHSPSGPIDRHFVEKIGARTRASCASTSRKIGLINAYRQRWKKELSVLDKMPEADILMPRTLDSEVRTLQFKITPEGSYMGMGPTYRLKREGSGYVAEWECSHNTFDEIAVHQEASDLGVDFSGNRFSLKLDQASRDTFMRLAKAGEQLDLIQYNNYPEYPLIPA